MEGRKEALYYKNQKGKKEQNKSQWEDTRKVLLLACQNSHGINFTSTMKTSLLAKFQTSLSCCRHERKPGYSTLN